MTRSKHSQFNAGYLQNHSADQLSTIMKRLEEKKDDLNRRLRKARAAYHAKVTSPEVEE